MPTIITARDIQPHDRILLCGREETVTHVEHYARVHVYTQDEAAASDPFLLRPGEIVTLLHRTA